VWTVTTLNASLQALAPEWVRGRIVSLFLLAWGLQPIGALIAGSLAEAVGVGATISGMTAVTLLLGASILRWEIPTLEDIDLEQRIATTGMPGNDATALMPSPPSGWGAAGMVVMLRWHVQDDALDEFRLLGGQLDPGAPMGDQLLQLGPLTLQEDRLLARVPFTPQREAALEPFPLSDERGERVPLLLLGATGRGALTARCTDRDGRSSGVRDGVPHRSRLQERPEQEEGDDDELNDEGQPQKSLVHQLILMRVGPGGGPRTLEESDALSGHRLWPQQLNWLRTRRQALADPADTEIGRAHV
jgi:hypothetical protein